MEEIPEYKKLKMKYLEESSTFNIQFLSKEKFYRNSKSELLEHFCTYKNYAILIKTGKESEISDKELEVPVTLVKINELKDLKKVNGNIVRKLQPSTLDKGTKFMLAIKASESINEM
jgi:hypothetical protein